MPEVVAESPMSVPAESPSSASLPASPPAILAIQGLRRQFAGSAHPAVADLSLTLPQGGILAVLGPSGCGKTTLLRLIAGFERPEAGRIEIGGQTVVGPGIWREPEQRSMGMVFQDFALFPHLTLAQNVAFGLSRLCKGDPEGLRQKVAQAIALVNLEGLERRYPHELSGGQQQRVALARALAPHPALLLLDEPFSNLDVAVRVQLRDRLRQILRLTQTSAVFVTHDQEEALSLADWVAVLRDGQLEQLGRPEELYIQPASRFVAEFVTQANFLEAQPSAEGWQTEVGCFTGDLVAGTPSIHQPATLMVRQEDLAFEPSEDGPLVVGDRQFLGREHRYCLVTPSGRELHARTSARQPLDVGTRVRLTLRPEDLRLFVAG